MALKVGELYASFGIDSSDLGKALSGIEKQCEQAAKTLAKTGAGLTLAVTTPLVALGKDILQSSIDFESAFAGVKKTVDSKTLKEAGMSYDTLSDALKRMTLEAPQTAEALAGIMEAGGQLGIDVTALEGFTKTIAALGVATNMTTDEAASMFAKFANITGMSQNEFENLGSTIVALGNNFATTENDIMTMAMRMASAGTTIGMTETDILAFATAMSSVGIMAEVGGSSFSTFASNLSLAVATSSDDLETYASIAGMTAEEFKTAFETDAASAINTFIQGLNDVDRNGMTAIQLLDQLGIKEVGMRNMLLSLANSGTLLSDALEMSASAWESNIALLEEANQRYGTTESQIQIMKNALELIKVDLGDFALPKVKDLTGHVVAATKAFLGMDDATKVAMLKMGGLAAAAGPALTAIGGLVGLAGNLAPMLGALISPVGILGAGLALFAVAAVDANNDIGKALESVSLAAKKSLASGNASLVGTMKKVSSRIPAIATSITKVIGNTVPGIIQLGFTALTGFADSISANADTIANIGMSIVENVCSGLSEGLPRFIPAAAQMVTGIGSAMISNLPRLASSIGEVASSIWDGLKSVDWLGLGKQLLSALGSAFSDLGEVLSGWFNSAKETLKGITWSDVAESIKAGISISSDWLKNLIAGDAATDTTTWSGIGKSIWTSIKSGISASGDWLAGLIMPEGTTFEAGTGWSSIGESIWEAIKGGISATGDWVKSLVLGTSYTADAGWSTVGSAIWTSIKSGISATGDWVKSLVLGSAYTADAGWSTVGEAIWTKIQTGITATGDWIKSLILGNAFTPDSDWTDVGEKIVSMISSGLSAIDFSAETMAANLSSLGNFVQTFVKNMLENKVELGTSITTFVTNLVTEISSFNGWATLATTFGTIATALINGIVSAIPTIATGAADLIAAIGGMLSSPATADFLAAATSVATTIINSIVEGIPTVVDGAKSIVAAIGTLLSNIDWSLALDSVTAIGKSLLDAIVAAIGGIGNFGESVVGAIGTALSNINWKELTVSLDGFVDMLANGISAGITAAADATSRIVASIGSLLGNINWEDFGDTAKEIGATIIAGIVQGMKTAISGASQIIGAIADLIKNIDWAEAGSAAADLAASLFDSIMDGAVNLVPDVFELLSALGRGIAAAGEGLGEAAGALITKLATGLLDPENWEKLLKVGGEIARGLATGLLELGKGIIEGAWNALIGPIKELLAWLGIIDDAGATVTAGSRKNISSGKGFAKDKSKGEVVDALVDAAKQAGEDTAEAFAEGYEMKTPEIDTTIEGTVDSAEVALETLPDVAELLGGDAAEGMADGIENNGNSATDAMKNLSDEVVKAALQEMSYETGYQTGYDYADAMRKGISSQNAAVTAVAAVLASDVRSTVSGIMSTSVGTGIGYQFANGIAQGIRNGIGAIISAATFAAQAALNASCSTLVIRSPSRRGEREVGWMYDDGIAKGILGNYGVIAKAASDVTGSMHDSFMVGDPSRGTVYTSAKSARQNAKEAAAQNAEDKSLLERARTMGATIAEELINSGALDSDVYMDGEKTGRKTAAAVSRKINRDSKKTVSGRTGKAVFA